MVKRRPKQKFEDTWLGKRATNFLDKLEPQQIGKAAKHGAVILPFVLAERKCGGHGIYGAASGALADRLIAEKVDLPEVTILGSSVRVNAGYAMLVTTLGLLGANGLFHGIGAQLLAAADLAAQGGRDAMIAQEKARDKWDKIAKDPASTPNQIGQANVEYQQSKVWRK
jgi:hypothetical protein